MSRIQASALIVYFVVAAVLPPPAAATAPPREWHFTALLDGKVIGYQSFRLSTHGPEKVLVSKARYNVKFLFMNAYSYTHDDREVWRDGCLNRIDSRTDDDGKRFFVHGTLADSRLVLKTAAGTEQLPGCVMTFAYWNPSILDAKRLLNAQTGEYLDVVVTPLGRDAIAAGGQARRADRYELKTEKFTIDLWYSPQREWLGLETMTESGRRLRYRLD